MTRKECEKKIMGLLQEIVDVYHEYNPDGEYLALQYGGKIHEDDADSPDYLQFNNRYWPATGDDPAGADEARPIDFSTIREMSRKKVSA